MLEVCTITAVKETWKGFSRDMAGFVIALSKMDMALWSLKMREMQMMLSMK